MAGNSWRDDEQDLEGAGGTAKPRPLNARERAWVARLQRVLEACPDRLALLTSGDAALCILDGAAARGRPLHDGWAERSGVVLDRIPGKPLVHGVS